MNNGRPGGTIDSEKKHDWVHLKKTTYFTYSRPNSRVIELQIYLEVIRIDGDIQIGINFDIPYGTKPKILEIL